MKYSSMSLLRVLFILVCLLCSHMFICQTEENVELVECRPTLPMFVLVSRLQLSQRRSQRSSVN